MLQGRITWCSLLSVTRFCSPREYLVYWVSTCCLFSINTVQWKKKKTPLKAPYHSFLDKEFTHPQAVSHAGCYQTHPCAPAWHQRHSPREPVTHRSLQGHPKKLFQKLFHSRVVEALKWCCDCTLPGLWPSRAWLRAAKQEHHPIVQVALHQVAHHRRRAIRPLARDA